MKKLATTLLSAAMCLSLAACGGTAAPAASSSQATQPSADPDHITITVPAAAVDALTADGEDIATTGDLPGVISVKANDDGSYVYTVENDMLPSLLAGLVLTDIDNDNAASTDTTAQTSEGEGQIGDYYVAITGAKLVQDVDGQQALVVTLDWTNNSTETNSAFYTLFAQAFQNGIEVDSDFFVDSDYAENLNRDVDPGVTITVDVAFALADDSEVTVKLTDVMGEQVVTKTFDPSPSSVE